MQKDSKGTWFYETVGGFNNHSSMPSKDGRKKDGFHGLLFLPSIDRKHDGGCGF